MTTNLSHRHFAIIGSGTLVLAAGVALVLHRGRSTQVESAAAPALAAGPQIEPLAAPPGPMSQAIILPPTVLVGSLPGRPATDGVPAAPGQMPRAAPQGVAVRSTVRHPEVRVQPGLLGERGPAPPVEPIAVAEETPGPPPGHLSERTFQAELRSYANVIAACSRPGKHAAGHVRASQGKVVLGWLIRSDGSTSSVEVLNKSDLDPAVEQCLTSAASRWRFTAPEGGDAHVTSAFLYL